MAPSVSCLAELESACDAVQIASDRHFKIFDVAYESSGDSLLPLLTKTLYERSYMTRLVREAPKRSSTQQTDLVGVLRTECRDAPRRDGGWRVWQVLDDGSILASKGGSRRLFGPGQYLVPDSPWNSLREGQQVVIFSNAASDRLQLGYYHFFGQTVRQNSEVEACVRIYWNVGVDGAHLLVRAVRHMFDRYQVPFQMKVPSYREGYGRRDAGVLYLDRRPIRLSLLLLREVQEQIWPHLDVDTPLFTKPLGRGMALAEDPGAGQSFGVHRCRWVSEGLFRAFKKGLSSSSEALAEVIGVFVENGVALDFPFLNPGSFDHYDVPGTRW